MLLSDARQRIRTWESEMAETIALENAEHQALEKQLPRVRWPLTSDEVAAFIKDIRKPVEPPG